MISFLFYSIASILETFVIGGLLKMVASFGGHPIPFRAAVALGLVFTIYDFRKIDWNVPNPELKETVEKFLMTMLGYGILALIILGIGFVFNLIFT